jgi:hypothetical protein
MRTFLLTLLINKNFYFILFPRMEQPRGKKRRSTSVDNSSVAIKKIKGSIKIENNNNNNNGDEQWSKYVKLQKSPNVRKKVSTAASTPKKQQSEEKKKNKKDSALHKHREPCDMMRNEVRSAVIQQQVARVEHITENANEQRALAIHVMPARKDQTYESLALRDQNANHIVFNDIDVCMQMKRLNYERSKTANSTNTTKALQELAEDGFFSLNNEHIDQTLMCLSKDLCNDVNFITYNRAEQARVSANVGRRKLLALKQGEVGGVLGSQNTAAATAALAKQDLSIKKLNIIFGNMYYSLGYHRRTPQLQHNQIKAKDSADRLDRFRAFFRDDQLEEETNIGEVAGNSPMFRDLCKQNLEKYKRRTETLRDAASLTPKVDLEIVTREYIDKFREPPLDGEERCANAEQCIFNTFSSDPHVCYIGKRFYTENEKARSIQRNLQQQQQQNGNEYALCYDCLLMYWTVTYYVNIEQEIIPERPINYFTVLCRPGQYSPHCMLKVMENDKPTGIVGFVPRFSLNNRRIVSRQRHILKENKLQIIQVPYLAEIGMDF